MNKIKKQLEGIQIGKKSSSSKSGGGAGALAIGASVAILSQLLKSTQAITGLLGTIGGMINSLVAPFVPILIGIMKPAFILLNVFLKKVLSLMGVGEESSGIDKLITSLQIGAGFIGILVASLIGGLSFLTILVGALVGVGVFNLGLWLGEQLAVLVIGVFNIGSWLGEQLAKLVLGEFPFQKWIAKKLSTAVYGLFDFGMWLRDKIKSFFKLDTLQNVAIDFVNSLIRGLNHIIDFMNKGLGVLGLDIDRVELLKNAPISSGVPAAISIVVEGDIGPENFFDKMSSMFNANLMSRGGFQ